MVDLRPMNPRFLAILPILSCCALLAQAPSTSAPASTSETHTNDLGFSYALPSDWQVVDAQPTLPLIKQQQSQSAATDEEKKGIECVQIALTARHGTPASVIVAVELPFGCFGQQMSEKDLPGFAQGASEGIKKTFVISEPVYGAYMLGTHNIWIERAKGVVIGHPEAEYTIEIACGLIHKGAVCWMAMAKDDAALKTFEQGKVSLDGETPAALVPPTAFDKKPAS